MSSELFMFENSFYSDPFSQFNDSKFPFEFLREIQENNNNNPFDETLDQIDSYFLSSSPHLGNAEYSVFQVKTEESRFNFDGFFSDYGNLIFPSFNLENQMFNSPENSFYSGEVRRDCSNGNLQNVKTNMQTRHVMCSSPLSTEKSSMEESSLKVEPYSAEERKERIDRYKAKRTRRNFNKTIKYVCRKTLADNRPRIRGRFARNDEALGIPKASMFHRCEDEDDVWIDGYISRRR